MSGPGERRGMVDDMIIDGKPYIGESIFPELDEPGSKPQSERERILAVMVLEMEETTRQKALQRPQSVSGPSLPELAEAALRALERPQRG